MEKGGDDPSQWNSRDQIPTEALALSGVTYLLALYRFAFLALCLLLFLLGLRRGFLFFTVLFRRTERIDDRHGTNNLASVKGRLGGYQLGLGLVFILWDYLLFLGIGAMTPLLLSVGVVGSFVIMIDDCVGAACHKAGLDLECGGQAGWVSSWSV